MTRHAPAVTYHNDRVSAAELLQRTSRMTGHWLGDVVRNRPTVHAPQDIPTLPRQLTPRWLTAALSGNIPGAEVVDFTCPHGDSGTSTRFALRVQWNEEGQRAGLPAELFVKTLASWQQRLALGIVDAIKGEPLFYSRFRPQIDIEAPVGYFATYEPHSWRSITIVEDVAATRGARFVSPLEPSDRAGMEDLLADLAVMHGRFWGDPELSSRGLRDSFNLISCSDRLVNLRRRSHVGVERAAGLVPAEVARRTDEIYDANFRTLELDRVMTSTLLHGDGHAGQRYQTSAGRTGLADWQVVHRGHWAWDVAYTMNTALSVDDRRAWDRDLLAFYLERLAKAGGQPPDFDQAWLEYRRHAFYPYIAWVFTLGHAWYQPKWQPDEYSLAIVERTAHAVLDLDAMSALPG